MRVLLVLALTATPLTAQVTDPQPRCSLLVMLQATQHHYACSPDNIDLRDGLQSALQLYAEYFARNSSTSLNEMVDAMQYIAHVPVEPSYICDDSGQVATFHDAMLVEPTRVVRTAQQHLAEDQPVDLDFDTHCFGEEAN